MSLCLSQTGPLCKRSTLSVCTCFLRQRGGVVLFVERSMSGMAFLSAIDLSFPLQSPHVRVATPPFLTRDRFTRSAAAQTTLQDVSDPTRHVLMLAGKTRCRRIVVCARRNNSSNVKHGTRHFEIWGSVDPLKRSGHTLVHTVRRCKPQTVNNHMHQGIGTTNPFTVDLGLRIVTLLKPAFSS